MEGQIREFRGFVLDEPEHRLRKDGVDVPLPPKAFEVLKYLAARPQQLVSYQEIMDAVWPDTFVEEGNLRLSVHTLRKTLGNDLIETVPRRGYRFNAETTIIERAVLNGEQTPVAVEAVRAPHVPPEPRRSRGRTVLTFVLLLLVGTGAISAVWYAAARSAPTVPSTDAHTIAVLPFEVISDDPAAERTLSKGLYEAATFNLKKIRGLRVITIAETGEASSDPDRKLRLGQQLGANEILQASVRSDGEGLRVSYELLSVSDGATVRNGSFVVNSKPSADSETAAALRLARELDKVLVRMRDKRRLPPGLLDETAERDYLLAQQLPRENDMNRWSEATGLMRSVVEKYPDWALGHAKLAEAMVLAHGSDGCGEARSVALRSIELDPKTAEAYLVKGVCDQIERKWTEAEASLKKAIELDEGLDRAHLEYGLLLDIQRRFAEGEVHLKKALELEPFAPYYNVLLCQHYYYDKKWSEALRHCELSQTIEPDYFLAKKWIYWVNVKQGRWDRVREITFGKISDAEALRNPLSRPLVIGDPRGFWQANLEDRLRDQNKRYSPVAIANYYAMLGDKEKTLEFLEKAVEADPEQAKFINPDPIFDLVRNDPRFNELMKRLGVATDNNRSEPTRSTGIN